MAKPASTEPVRFEDALGDLEQTVQRLESGDLSLEDALAAFERGVALVRMLNDKLTEVERKVEVLMRAPDGTARTRPLEADEE